jgi:site-specific DNA-cytosine methylase
MLAGANLPVGPDGLLHLTEQVTILEVFSGPNQSAQQAIRRICSNPDMLRVITVDINANTNPTIVTDVNRWNPSSALGDRVDFAWLSPPCPEYSVAKTTGSRNLGVADATAKAALRIITQVRPRAWVIENPTGLLRHRPFMQSLATLLQPTTYCMFDDYKYRKETDIWTNIPCPLPHCRLTPCKDKIEHGKHSQTAQRGRSKNGTPGNKEELLHRVPHGLVQRLFLFAYREGDNLPSPVLPDI